MIDTNQVVAHLRRGVPLLVLPLCFHVEPLGRGLQPERGGVISLAADRVPECVAVSSISRIGSKTSMSGAQRDVYAVPTNGAKPRLSSGNLARHIRHVDC